ncbi:hypothetical protein [Streptomyces sp. SAJ15]|uniref:hypothetical protein n=1 Tax=Streptomyces sp. SAJ15 TaxID=2011095 RepID=UPI00135EB6DF|nr:hypothetical protein [Streptomyces sp. SAJ15]TVL92399.1 hypothetical protein CD790_11960 [Streptomyces sp. SAJ15]
MSTPAAEPAEAAEAAEAMEPTEPAEAADARDPPPAGGAPRAAGREAPEDAAGRDTPKDAAGRDAPRKAVRRRAVLRDALLRPLLLPAVLATVGVLLGQWLPLADHIEDPGYSYLTGGLLAVGLYGSAYGIARPQARRDLGRILVAVTFGVLLKAALIAGVLALAHPDRPEYLVLAVAMAQIDPLSVAALMERREMSPRAKSLLAAWASFDDPVTTILVVYAGALVLDGAESVGAGGAAYGATLPLNLALVLLAAALWAALRGRAPMVGSGTRGAPTTTAAAPAAGVAPTAATASIAGGVPTTAADSSDDKLPTTANFSADEAPTTAAGSEAGRLRTAAQTTALLALLALATWQFLMLGLAVTALFFRPALGRLLGRATSLSLLVATLLLGMLLTQGVHPGTGVLLGATTFLAQTAVASVITRGFDRRDRLALAVSQQNGITAIILALLLQPLLPEAVAIIAPAIITVNALHAAATGLLALSARGRAGTPAPGPGAPPQDECLAEPSPAPRHGRESRSL